MKSNSTIIAQCTPVGSGAIALIRLSGKDCFDIVGKFSKFSGSKSVFDFDSHTVNFGYVVSGENVVDQVMFIVMRAPRTFTGENVVEITCHNNQFIVEDIINLAISFGARLAQPGEFAKRAFLNNKIDLVQAESINELIHASNQLALKQSLSQLEGSFSSWVSKIESKFVHCLALSEASFEFLDDEMEFKDQILEILNQIQDSILEIKNSYSNKQNIREGVRIAILGSVNAGKSSLFNSLIKKDRAIVTNIAGTTRDVIEAGVYTSDSYLTLVDTAGIRSTDDIIEKEGISRSFKEAEKSDIVLLVLDSSRELLKDERIFYEDLFNKYNQKVVVVFNKIDSLSDDFESNIFGDFKKLEVSTINGQGLNLLNNAIEKKIKDLLASNQTSFLLNKRHYSLLMSVLEKLDSMIKITRSKNVEYEILSIHIKDALENLSELTGKTISEMGMDAVFKEFCVGK